MDGKIEQACNAADWMQVYLNGGPPCFHLDDDGYFCLRAMRWDGHIGEKSHKYVSLYDLIATAHAEGKAEGVREERAACAKIAVDFGGGKDFWSVGLHIAKAIRARRTP